MMGLSDFYEAIAQVKRGGPHLRWGQLYFNFLVKVDPDFAEAIRATEHDPFHIQDHETQRLAAFRDYLAAHWESKGRVEV